MKNTNENYCEIGERIRKRREKVHLYNILRLIGQESLKSRRAPKTKHPVKRRRIRTVIGNLIQIAGHITTHGRRIVLAIGCSNVWRHVFMDVYNRFALA